MGGCKSKKEMCSGALLERCCFEELKIDCVIVQLKPGLKSKVNGAILYIFYLKSVLVENATYLLVHEQIRLLSGDAFSLCTLKF